MSRFNELLGDVDLSLSTMSSNTQAVASIRLDRISSDPRNPRKTFNEAALKEMAQSMRERGVLQPITLRPIEDGKRYIIRYGDRRFRAAQLAGLKEIPAIVAEGEADANDVLDQVIENDQREPLSPMETADAVADALANGISKQQIAQRLGRPQATISMYVAMAEFPPELSGEFLEKAPLRAAYDLFNAWKKHPGEVLAFVAANPDGVTAAKAAAFVQSLKRPTPPKATSEAGSDSQAEPEVASPSPPATAEGGEEPSQPVAKSRRQAPAVAGSGKPEKQRAEVWLPVSIDGRAGRVRLPDTVEVEFEGGERETIAAADLDPR